MCGICGIYSQKGAPIDRVLLSNMISVLSHRGPDGEGHLIEVGVGLGHRRLSIIDIEGGSQPISNENYTIHVVFNGEIYNFIELRKELEVFGHQFKTKSDTEVIVHAYEQWGRNCVTHFNGMFAFAIWDSVVQELFLARDHLGVKPLYYVGLDDRVLFASEVKSLLQDPDCPRDIDMQALAELFTFRYVPSPRTLFKNVYKLPPGHWMICSDRGIKIERYWKWVPQVRKTINEAELIEEYQSLLIDAIRLQMRSDVPLGLFLSSGVDSGGLLAIMRKFTSARIQAFTIGFEGGEKTNEVADAKLLADSYGAEHFSMIVTPQDYLKYYENYLWNLEEPLGNESAAAFYFVSKIASSRVKVVLTGQGADEPWAGYDRYVGVKLSNLYSLIPTSISTPFAKLVNRIPARLERIKRGVYSLPEKDVLTRFAKVYSFFNDEMKHDLFRGPLAEFISVNEYKPKDALVRLQKDVQHLDLVTQMLYMDTRASLPDDLLMVGDKMSMSNSIEARVPFLDYRLVEFAESLPSHMKLNGITGKYLHKKALQKWLPKSVVYRKKKGFANPIEYWFRKELRLFAEEALLAPDSPMATYFDQSYLHGMLEMDRKGKAQLRRHIYLLISFVLWHRTFMQNRTS